MKIEELSEYDGSQLDRSVPICSLRHGVVDWFHGK